MIAVACLPDLAAVGSTTEGGAEGGREGGADAARLEGGLCGNGVIDPGEQCDPGDAGAVGCQPDCAISCPPAFDGGVAYVDDLTNHCYFTLEDTGTYAQAIAGCTRVGGGTHVVTFVSGEEYSLVGTKLLPPNAPTYWVGLSVASPVERDEAGAPYYSSVHDEEPGWAPIGDCAGCYASSDPMGDPFTGEAFPHDPDAGGDCVTGSPLEGFRAADCTADKLVVCEREPPGSRTVACPSSPADFCMTVPFTADSKRYVLHVPAPDAAVLSSTDALHYCYDALDGGGSQTGFIIFQSREEREEVWHEVANHVPVNVTSFWFGLHQEPDAGQWEWDNGMLTTSSSAPPPEWGLGAPEDAGYGRASAVYQGVGAPDRQLAHTINLGPSPFVCQAQF